VRDRRVYEVGLPELEQRLGFGGGEEIVTLQIDHTTGTVTVVTNGATPKEWLAPGASPHPRELPAHARVTRPVRDNPQA